MRKQSRCSKKYCARAVTNAAIASCDAADGVTDGLLNDPRQCTYNPVSDTAITKDTCTQGDDSCLTRAEAGVMQKIWGGARNASGIQLWPGTERGATTIPMAGPVPFPAATEQGKYFVQFEGSPESCKNALSQEIARAYHHLPQLGPKAHRADYP